MGTAYVEKRAVKIGSVICENEFASLRVIRSGPSLELSLDTIDEGADTTSLLYSPLHSDDQVAAPSGEPLSLRFFTFDPVLIAGRTRGVQLHGMLGPHPADLTMLLDAEAPWCQLSFEVRPRAPLQVTRLTHHWQLQPEWAEPDIRWPDAPVARQALPANPAAFFQLGPLFAALIPDLEEGDCRHFGLCLHAQRELDLEYGVMLAGEESVPVRAPLRFAYALCLDARALPDSGFQEVVRLLGAHDMLETVSATALPEMDGALPPLPATPDDDGWAPFMHEGSPAEIAALVLHYLAQSGESEWESLDAGLRWLDRLCLHQHLVELPGGLPFGSFPGSAAWAPAARWMPHLLLTAYRLTGIQEYAYRGIAALDALPAAGAATRRPPHRYQPR